MSRGFDSTLVAWASPRGALLHQNLSGAVPLKAVVGKLRDEGFSRSPSRAVAHICPSLQKDTLV